MSTTPPRPSSHAAPQRRRRRPAAAPSAGRVPGAPVPRRRPRWVMRAATTLSVVVLASAGIGHAVVSSLDAGIMRVDPFRDMKNRPPTGHGMNVLLVGTDGRDGLTAQERRRYRLGGEPCHCTDTMMIVHLSADRERASVVSLPRDTYVQLPASTDPRTGRLRPPHAVKLNAAYAEGGPALTVRTVESLTHLKIDHYLEVDFTTFMRTVDVLGGVRLCTTEPLKDSYTGLDLPAGTHTLGGGQALQYVRSRHLDAVGDLGRMQRQQRFLAALIDRATSSRVLLNPIKFRDVTRAVLGSVRADRNFHTDELLDLGRAMRNFSPASSEFTTVPIARASYPVPGLGSTVQWDEGKAQQLFRKLREDRPLATARPARRPDDTVAVAVAPSRIRVQVENGTSTVGLGRRVDTALRTAGFATTGAPVDSQQRGVRRTQVLYDPRWDRSARSLAAALPGSELRAVAGQGATMRVIVGTDHHAVRKVKVEDPARSAARVVRGDEVTCG
ncbi:LytR family transcriptional regulator [Streptomyces thermoviolaceus subsp. thermoviolaceus]|uniref:LCP family protein n=1 Tax=Streptomyces thermoviolaceus subsp. thermoviolaceus TaxID=66860 RepID=A0ABX0YW98_STRTL|nr:LCP family protein [Streptomyces thermoviolaceus]NJP16312.1 LCP family protein [Streptomyces thermoviolaceus subsp. thermoviolaceus]GHB08280.1 LytR family transcriptional regulator [Streptomyces thermoviolaceus subsp. thermoviolaceus]